MIGMFRRLFILLAAALLLAVPRPAPAADWPQLQRDAARTGRTSDTVAAPYRARWIWLGPTQTLRNQLSETGWTHDLTSREGYSYPTPSSVSFAISDGVQPVLVNNRLFVGTLDGGAYGINAFDGSTAWSATLASGTSVTAAVSENGAVVVFATLSGVVHGLSTSNGQQAWSYPCRKAITGAPCVKGSNVHVADHSGRVYAISTSTGSLAWDTSLPAPVMGGMCADDTTLYVGAENMYVYALNLSDGQIRASHRVRGQSFRQLWPVVFNGKVWVSTVTTPIIGSEYVMESLMAGSTSFSQEESNIALWLQGSTNWTDSGEDWKHLFALNTSNLAEPFTVLAGPAEGCGIACEPVVIDNSGRVLTYFKTRYPTLTKANGGVFGTAYSVDIAAVDQTNGHRIRIDNGQFANPWPWETDNLYAMSVAGNILWLRQNFRGTLIINLANSTSRGVSAEIRHRDGGNFMFDVVYRDQLPEIGTTQRGFSERAAAIVVGDTVYITENFGITAIENAN